MEVKVLKEQVKMAIVAGLSHDIRDYLISREIPAEQLSAIPIALIDLAGRMLGRLAKDDAHAETLIKEFSGLLDVCLSVAYREKKEMQ
jgi:hypothetical protein